jgi:hypothetical protein
MARLAQFGLAHNRGERDRVTLRLPDLRPHPKRPNLDALGAAT